MNLKVINGNNTTKCTVTMDNTVSTFTDFVAVGYDAKSGKTTFLQNTDAVTLGMASKMIMKAFMDAYNALDKKDKLNIDSILGVS